MNSNYLSVTKPCLNLLACLLFFPLLATTQNTTVIAASVEHKLNTSSETIFITSSVTPQPLTTSELPSLDKTYSQPNATITNTKDNGELEMKYGGESTFQQHTQLVLNRIDTTSTVAITSPPSAKLSSERNMDTTTTATPSSTTAIPTTNPTTTAIKTRSTTTEEDSVTKDSTVSLNTTTKVTTENLPRTSLQMNITSFGTELGQTGTGVKTEPPSNYSTSTEQPANVFTPNTPTPTPITTTMSTNINSTVEAASAQTTDSPLISIVLKGAQNKTKVVQQSYLPTKTDITISNLLLKPDLVQLELIQDAGEASTQSGLLRLLCEPCNATGFFESELIGIPDYILNTSTTEDDNTVISHCSYKWYRNIWNPMFKSNQSSYLTSSTKELAQKDSGEFFWCETYVWLNEYGDLISILTQIAAYFHAENSSELNNDSQNLTEDQKHPNLVQFLPNGYDVNSAPELSSLKTDQFYILLPCFRTLDSTGEVFPNVEYCTNITCEKIDSVSPHPIYGVFMDTSELPEDLFLVQNFTCLTSNQLDSQEITKTDVFIWPVRNQTITFLDYSVSSPDTMQIKQGSSIAIQCQFQLHLNNIQSPNVVHWQYSNADSKTFAYNSNDTLFIKNLTSFDTGKYTCTNGQDPKAEVLEVYLFAESEQDMFVVNKGSDDKRRVENFEDNLKVPCATSNRNSSVALEVCVHSLLGTNCYFEETAQFDPKFGFNIAVDASETSNVSATCKLVMGNSNKTNTEQTFHFYTGKAEIIYLIENNNASNTNFSLTCPILGKVHESDLPIIWKINGQKLDKLKDRRFTNQGVGKLTITNFTRDDTWQYCCYAGETFIKTFYVFIQPENNSNPFVGNSTIVLDDESEGNTIQSRVSNLTLKPTLKLCTISEQKCETYNDSSYRYNPLKGFLLHKRTSKISPNTTDQVFVSELNGHREVHYKRPTKHTQIIVKEQDNVTLSCGCDERHGENNSSVSWNYNRNSDVYISDFLGCNTLKLSRSKYNDTGVFTCYQTSWPHGAQEPRLLFEYFVFVESEEYPFILNSSTLYINVPQKQNETILIPIRVTSPNIVPSLVDDGGRPIKSSEFILWQGIKVNLLEISGPQIYITWKTYNKTVEIFTDPKKDIIIPLNETRKIFCGNSNETVWERNLIAVSKNEKPKNESFITIHNASSVDTGSYSCLINNTLHSIFYVYVPDYDHAFVNKKVTEMWIEVRTSNEDEEPLELILPCRTSFPSKNVTVEECAGEQECREVDSFTLNKNRDIVVHYKYNIAKYVCGEKTTGQFIEIYPVSISSNKVVATVDKNVTFHCGPTDLDTVAYKWTFEGQFIDTLGVRNVDVVSKRGLNSLKIWSADVNNIGRYKCLKNGTDEIVQEYYLYVKYGGNKSFVNSDPSSIVIKGDEVSKYVLIPCRVVEPDLTYDIVLCEKNVKNCVTRKKDFHYDADKGAVLMLNEFTRAVKCISNSNNETVTYILHILPENFKIVPKVLSNKKTEKRIQSEEFNLTCSVQILNPTDVLPYKIRWLFQNKTITPIQNTIEATFDEYSSFLTSKASFGRANATHEGEYKCGISLFNQSQEESHWSINSKLIEVHQNSTLDVKLTGVVIKDKDLSLARLHEVVARKTPYEVIIYKVSNKAAVVTLTYMVTSLPGLEGVKSIKDVYKIQDDCIDITDIDGYHFNVTVTANIPSQLVKFNGFVNTTFDNKMQQKQESVYIKTFIEPSCDPQEPENLLVFGKEPCQHKLYPVGRIFTFGCTFNSIDIMTVNFTYNNTVFDNSSNAVKCSRRNAEVYNKIACNLSINVTVEKNVSCFGTEIGTNIQLNHTFVVKLADNYLTGVDLSYYKEDKKVKNLTVYDFETVDITCTAPKSLFKEPLLVFYIDDNNKEMKKMDNVQFVSKDFANSVNTTLTFQKFHTPFNKTRTILCKAEYLSGNPQCEPLRSNKFFLNIKKSEAVKVDDPAIKFNKTKCHVIPNENGGANDSDCENIRRCAAHGKPKPRVSWYKGTNVTEENETPQTLKVDLKYAAGEFTDYTVLNTNVLRSSSFYTCHAYNTMGNVNKTDSFTIFVDVFEKPQIKFQTNFFNNPDPKDINFQVIKGNPKPKPQFSKLMNESDPSSYSSWENANEENGKYYLFKGFYKLAEDRSGKYKVEAKNAAGKDTELITIRIERTKEPNWEMLSVVAILGAFTSVTVVTAVVTCIKRFHEIKKNGGTGGGFEKNIMELKKMSVAGAVDSLPLNVPEVQQIRNWGLILEESQLEIHDKIGQGAFGTVYRGYMNVTGTTARTEVAIKQLKNGVEDTRSLCIEMALLLHVRDHQNVLKLLGITTNRTMKLVLEYAPFGNLRSFLKANRCNFPNYILPPNLEAYRANYRRIDNGEDIQSAPFRTQSMSAAATATLPKDHHSPLKCSDLAINNLLGYALQMSQGMIYLHSKHMIHRDLAARNILVFSEKHVKIGDFGLARNLYQNSVYHMTNNKVPFRWMAVETIRDSNYSYQSDVWSFGILLWEIFTLGSDPYPGFTDDRDLFDKLREGYRMECPNLLVEDQHRDVYDLMLNCWEHSPQDRIAFRQIKEFLKNKIDDDELLSEILTEDDELNNERGENERDSNENSNTDENIETNYRIMTSSSNNSANNNSLPRVAAATFEQSPSRTGPDAEVVQSTACAIYTAMNGGNANVVTTGGARGSHSRGGLTNTRRDRNDRRTITFSTNQNHRSPNNNRNHNHERNFNDDSNQPLNNNTNEQHTEHVEQLESES